MTDDVEEPEAILEPDELGPDEEDAAALGENRYLVATEGELPTGNGPADLPGTEPPAAEPPNDAPGSEPPAIEPPADPPATEPPAAESPDNSPGDEPPSAADADVEPAAVAESQYEVAITVRSEHGVHSEQIDTDDVREAFDGTVEAFCAAVAPETPTEQALSVLLAPSDVVDGGR